MFRILDLLNFIHDHLDPTLAYRHQLCRDGLCHSCDLTVDGKQGVACLTMIGRRDELVIEARRGYPRIRDLIVDFGTQIDMLEQKQRIIVNETIGGTKNTDHGDIA